MNSINKRHSWKTINNQEFFKRDGIACGVYKDRYILIAGGVNGGGGGIRNRLQSTVMYDTLKDSYISLPDLPHQGRCCGVVLLDYFYVAKSHVQLYRISLSKRLKWEKVASQMNDMIVNMVTDGRHLYMFGQRGGLYRFNYSTVNTLRRYDPMSNEVINMPSRQFHVNHHAFVAAVVSNKIYAIGAEKVNGTAKVEIFDVTKQSWSQAPPLPRQLCFVDACSIDRWVLMTGGYLDQKDEFHIQVYVLDSWFPEWRDMNATLLPHRLENKCVKVGSQIISVGGSDQFGNYCPIESIYIKHFIPDWSFEMIRHFVLLRELTDQNRAKPVILTKKLKHDSNALLDFDKLIQKLFTDIPLDIFRNVISYLIH